VGGAKGGVGGAVSGGMGRGVGWFGVGGVGGGMVFFNCCYFPTPASRSNPFRLRLLISNFLRTPMSARSVNLFWLVCH